ncbi:MAG: 23S rRNA pseudouridine(1911/1915/1917) synthase RluD [Gallionella sp.]|nr:23S rRNA pseudouridine(1911/1915/1917) synthase RluD [Gallionella sp.]MDD4946629.1 23S rRNA pseudouridine(1911/1915/1917) synthase RluD [Gallionella sp.]MDD5612912.1 23S rRNA pseudouridine(1911/1915/1917) synthase RluD [Gallionella sp.]
MTESEKNLRDYNANTPTNDAIHLVVPADLAGLRLDQALAKLLPEYSRSRLQEWVTGEQVLLDGKPAIPRQKVWGGEQLNVLPQIHPADRTHQAEDIPLDIVHEDEALIVINKPVGLVAHPGSGNWQGTLLNALLHHAPQLENVPRAGIVHRLDKDTSGLLVVAKTLIAQTHLVRQLQARSVKREYLALVHGEVGYGGCVDEPIGRHPTNRVKMAVTVTGKPAVTHFRVEETFPSCTLLRCSLETGRTHQIRVHMAWLGHPLVGDSVYRTGAQRCVPELRELLNQFPRQALHATRLALEHPTTSERMEWHAPMPDDMQTLLEEIREALDDCE